MIPTRLFAAAVSEWRGITAYEYGYCRCNSTLSVAMPVITFNHTRAYRTAGASAPFGHERR